jgi:hypothetical protein
MSEQSSFSHDGQRAGSTYPVSSAPPNPLDAERLTALRVELSDRLADERSAEVLLFHASSHRNRCADRVHQTAAAIALLEKRLGVMGDPIWPNPRDDEPLNDPGALARFGALVQTRIRPVARR